MAKYTPSEQKDRALASKYKAEAKISQEKAKMASANTLKSEYRAEQAKAAMELARQKNADYQEKIHQRDKQLEMNKSLRTISGIGNVVGGMEKISSSVLAHNIPSKIQTGTGYNNFVSPQNAYVIKKSRNVIIPTNYNSVIGMPCLTTYTLSELVGFGFTVCEAFHLEGIPATSKELQSIDEYLKNGIIL